MSHDTPLIATIVGGLVLAFVFGTIAVRLKMPPLIGYLLAGIAMGPYTPGFVGDAALAQELAEIGVILLMFGVGLHFSLKDLLAVKSIAIPGAAVQLAIATLLGMGLAHVLGWPLGGGVVFGLALSCASTVVLLTALQEHHLLETARGKIAIGWLIVEDIAMVLALVLIPALSGLTSGPQDSWSISDIAWPILLTLGKVAAFVIVMLVVGRRFIPWVLERIADTGSRELFRLAVLAIALGFALGSAYIFDVSFALGAFFAGMILSESELSHRAAEESLPLRDAFAVLFFVSVGMLFDPSILIRHPFLVLATLMIIVVGKALAAMAIVLILGHPARTALTIAASLSQIGEFSFILATLGLSLGLLPAVGRDLILSGAILSILINPLMFFLSGRIKPWFKRSERPALDPALQDEVVAWAPLNGHVVLAGYGDMGRLLDERLTALGHQILVIVDDAEAFAALRSQKRPALLGNAAGPHMMDAADIGVATHLVLAIPDPIEAGQIAEHALAIRPGLCIVGHAQSSAEEQHLRKHGVSQVVTFESEIVNKMVYTINAGSRPLQKTTV